MKKSIVLLVVGILVLTGLEAAAISLHRDGTTRGDELDQSMAQYQGVLPLGRTNIFGYYANLSVAQSFIPQKHTQTRVELLAARNATSLYPFWLAIRANLTGEDLAIVALTKDKFPLVNGTPTENQMAWVEFDFPDVVVTPGQTYYIVTYTSNVTENYYWISGNGSNPYSGGQVYVSLDEGATWIDDIGSIHFYDADACFKTYGISNQAPSTPTINGPATGKISTTYTYTFDATDPEGDQIYYCINWGDGTPEICIGPFASGAPQIATHAWSEKGTYVIKAKAKDIYDAESLEGTLSVTMPRARMTDALFLTKLFEQFPHAFSILRHLFGL